MILIRSLLICAEASLSTEDSVYRRLGEGVSTSVFGLVSFRMPVHRSQREILFFLEGTYRSKHEPW